MAIARTSKVVLLGSNPSNASPHNDPFTHCKSRIMLEQWLPALGLTVDDVEFMNVSDEKTPNNRPLSRREILNSVPSLTKKTAGKVVITLGKTALDAMIDVVDDYRGTTDKDDDTPTIISMPHPSGRNRQLNDKEWVAKQLAWAKDKLQRVRDLPLGDTTVSPSQLTEN